ncbi:erythromycin resistance leader peptide [Bacillus tuaregi]
MTASMRLRFPTLNQ